MSGCISVLDEDNVVTRAPYRLKPNGRIVINVNINGSGPFSFALDSAASISAVSQRTRDRLDLANVPGKNVFVHGAVTSGVFDLVEMDSLSIGSQQWIRTHVVALPGTSRALRDLDGIVGIDILRDYAVGFLARERSILLYRPDVVAGRAYRGWASIPLIPRTVGDSGAVVYSIGLRIKGHRIPAIFDLGAELNIVNSLAARRFGVRLNKARNEEFSGALETAPILANLTIAEVATRDLIWRDEEFSVADLSVFTRFGLEQGPAAIVGARLFTQRDFIIDFSRRRLLIRQSKAEYPSAE